MEYCISIVGDDHVSGNGGVNENILMSRAPIWDNERLFWIGTERDGMQFSGS